MVTLRGGCAVASAVRDKRGAGLARATDWAWVACDNDGMSASNVRLLRRCAELLNVGDWDALFELYDADVQVEFRDVAPPPDVPEVIHGLEGVRRIAAHWTAPYDELGAEVYEYVESGSWVICDTRWHRKSKGSDLRSEVRFADAYEVEQGKMRRAIIGFRDVQTALEGTASAAP
jgi:SnoaL-like domain